MKYRMVVILTIAVLSIGSGTGAGAQSRIAPVIFNHMGDLWSLDGPNGKPKQLTTWGSNESPVISPDGKEVAYNSDAQIYVDYVNKSSGDAGGERPSNIWVLDIGTGDAIRIADQPAGASFTRAGESHYISRSDPTWSPDGREMAWGEELVSGNLNSGPVSRAWQVVIYNLAQKSSKVVPYNFPKQGGFFDALEVKWGKAGLATFNWPQSPSPKSVMVLSIDGKVLANVETTDAAMHNVRWIQDQGKEYVAFTNSLSPEAWTLIDPVKGDSSDMDGVPELYSLGAPDGLSVFWTPEDAQNGQGRIALGGKEIETIDGGGGSLSDFSVAISPDGKQLAFWKFDSATDSSSIVFWADGKSSASESLSGLLGGIIWGPIGWRVRHEK